MEPSIRILPTNSAVSLQMGVLNALRNVNAFMNGISFRKPRLDVADMAVNLGHDVALRIANARRGGVLGMNNGSARQHSLLGIEDGRKNLVLNFDKGASGLCFSFAIGNYCGDALAGATPDAIENHHVVDVVGRDFMSCCGEVALWHIFIGKDRMNPRR